MTKETTRFRRLPRLLPAVALIVVLMCATTVVLRPTATTQARWHDEETVAVTVRTDTVALNVTESGPRGDFVLSGTSAVEWAPATVSVTAGDVQLTATELAGSTVGYALPVNGVCLPNVAPTFVADLLAVTGSATSFPVTGSGPLPLEPGAAASLCLMVVPGDAVRSAHPGAVLQVETTVASSASGPASWTSTTKWTSPVSVPVLPTVPTTCQTVRVAGSGWFDGSWNVTLAWQWMDADGTTSEQPVTRWEIQRRSGSDWATFHSVAATARSATLNGHDFPQWDWNVSYDLRVRAVVDGGATVTGARVPIVAFGEHARCAS